MHVPSSANGTIVGTHVVNVVVRCHDRVFYRGDDGVSGWKPWVTDSTAAGTKLLFDIQPGAGFSSPQDFRRVGDVLVFAADDGVNGYEMWRTDGTPGGTFLLVDACPGGCDGVDHFP